MLKVIKYEAKRAVIIPLSLAVIGTLVNFIFMIMASNPSSDIRNILRLSNSLSQLTAVITTVLLAFMLVLRSFKPYALYDLTDVSENKIVCARLLMVFTFGALIALIMTAESSAVASIAFKTDAVRAAENNSYLFYNFVMYGRGFLSWLHIFGFALYFTWAFALCLSTAAATRFMPSRISKVFVFIGVAAAGVTIQYGAGSLLANGAGVLNFNTLKYFDTYRTIAQTTVPVNSGYFFIDSSKIYNATFFHFNILNLAEVLFAALQIAACSMLYTLRRVPVYKPSPKARKSMLKLILPAVILVFSAIFGLAVTNNKPALRCGGSESSNSTRYEAAVDYRNPYNLADVYDIDKLKKLPEYLEVIIDVRGSPFEAGTIKFYILGEDMHLSADNKILTFSTAGAYSVSIQITNKFTTQKFYLPYLSIKAENGGANENENQP